MSLRIVTLLPSATEIVACLGAVDELVARSHECDFPAGVERLPVLTSARIDFSGSSAEIHAQMENVATNATTEALSIYKVDEVGLRRLAPDVVVTQAQCEVCAVSEDDVRAAIAGWEGAPALVSLKAENLAGVYVDIINVAKALGREEIGVQAAGKMKDHITEIAFKASDANWKPRLLVIEWMEPLMAGGNWMPELVSLAGGENLLSEPGKHSPWINWEDIIAADPDAIICAPCGFELDRVIDDLPALTSRPGWADLRAVREGRFALADGNAYFNRPGPRLSESVEILAEFLHPELFDFGHEGRNFQRF
ncbi:MAG: iron complex transport system substrate-binding protein [Alphaproteobacteria bacterium]|jgi:iron complex transport system substrate-binding protein